MDVEYRYDWKLIACVDDHWGIGRQGQLLVDIPADKKAFVIKIFVSNLYFNIIISKY